MANGFNMIKMWLALIGGIGLTLMGIEAAFGTTIFDLFGLFGDTIGPWIMLVAGLCVIFTNKVVMGMFKR